MIITIITITITIRHEHDSDTKRGVASTVKPPDKKRNKNNYTNKKHKHKN